MFPEFQQSGHPPDVLPSINISCLPLPTSVSGARLRARLRSGTSKAETFLCLDFLPALLSYSVFIFLQPSAQDSLFEAQYLSINGM